MNKEEARSRARAQKSLLTDAERRRSAIDVFEQIENLAAFMVSEHILMYHSLRDELSTLEFLDKWHEKKQFFLPRVNGVNLDILPYDRSSLRLGAFQIEEPDGDATVDVDSLDLLIVPGMAFDKKGNRVGRGKGFYDRLLKDSKALKVGVAYDCQIFDEIDIDVFDVPVDIVVTPSRTYIRRRSGNG